MTEKGLTPGRRVAVIDLETSGLSIRRHRILQVGLVITDEAGTVESTWSSLVAPRWWRVARVGPTWLHGIRRADLRGAPRERQVLSELRERVGDAMLVAHNLSFDWGFLRRAARRHHVELPAGERLCTLQLSRRLDPDRHHSHRLADLAERYGIAHDQPHHALSDAYATAALLPHLRRDAESAGRADLMAQLVER